MDSLIQPPAFLLGTPALPNPVLSSCFGISEVRLSSELSLSLVGTQGAPSSPSCLLALVWEFFFYWFFLLPCLPSGFPSACPIRTTLEIWMYPCPPALYLSHLYVCSVLEGSSPSPPCWAARPRVLSLCWFITISVFLIPNTSAQFFFMAVRPACHDTSYNHSV